MDQRGLAGVPSGGADGACMGMKYSGSEGAKKEALEVISGACVISPSVES